jgi:glutaredoxin
MASRLSCAALLAALLLAGASQAWAQTLYRWTDGEGRVTYSDQLPPPDARNVQERQPGTGNYVDSNVSYALRKAVQDYPVTLYTGAQCQAECSSARTLLTRRGVPFSEISVRSDEDITRYRQIFGGEEIFVPALTVGSQKLKGYEQAAWQRLLDQARYPRTGPSAQ